MHLPLTVLVYFRDDYNEFGITVFPATITEKLPAAVVKQAFSLSADERQTLFLDYVEKAESVWLLKGAEGFVMIAGEDGERLPVWPHFDLASAWRDSDEEGVEAVSVSLSQFKDDWLPGLGKNNIELVLCPSRLETADPVLTAEELLASFQDVQ